jgi:hypothetical protein
MPGVTTGIAFVLAGRGGMIGCVDMSRMVRDEEFKPCTTAVLPPPPPPVGAGVDGGNEGITPESDSSG